MLVNPSTRQPVNPRGQTSFLLASLHRNGQRFRREGPLRHLDGPPRRALHRGPSRPPPGRSYPCRGGCLPGGAGPQPGPQGLAIPPGRRCYTDALRAGRGPVARAGKLGPLARLGARSWPGPSDGGAGLWSGADGGAAGDPLTQSGGPGRRGRAARVPPLPRSGRRMGGCWTGWRR